MKKFNFKKMAVMGLSAIMTASAMSMTAMAADIATLTSKTKASSVTNSEIREGVLPNGLEYKITPMTEDEIEAFNSGITTYSYSWSGNVTVPIVNGDGTNGAQVGHDFIIAPDVEAVISVGGLPATTMPTINIGASVTNGMWTDWIPNVGSYEKVTLSPSADYTNYSFRVKVSTSESYSRSARFSIETQ